MHARTPSEIRSQGQGSSAGEIHFTSSTSSFIRRMRFLSDWLLDELLLDVIIECVGVGLLLHGHAAVVVGSRAVDICVTGAAEGAIEGIQQQATGG